jgi:hypothetical protein
MGGLKIGVGLVERVAAAIVVERVDLAPDMAAHFVIGAAIGLERARAVVGALVDIVAIVEHEIHRLLCNVAPGGEQALLVVLATGGHEPQALDAGTGGRQRPGASHRAFLAPDPEAIPVGAIGGQPGHLDMDRVGQFGMGQCLALRDERLEARVPGHFPAHRDRPWLHPAQGFERSGREPGPEHETVTGRIARGHPSVNGSAPNRGFASRLRGMAPSCARAASGQPPARPMDVPRLMEPAPSR